MFDRKFLIIIVFLFINLCSSVVLASGGEDNDDSSDDDSFGGSFSSSEVERVVDHTYESGKAVYTGRKKSAPKLAYCLRSGDELVPLKRKSIKAFKESSFSELAKNLYQCDVPDQLIKSQLERTDFLHVLYYLDKRYKLKLERA